jgi:hypothetical protein
MYGMCVYRQGVYREHTCILACRHRVKPAVVALGCSCGSGDSILLLTRLSSWLQTGWGWRSTRSVHVQ